MDHILGFITVSRNTVNYNCNSSELSRTVFTVMSSSGVTDRSWSVERPFVTNSFYFIKLYERTDLIFKVHLVLNPLIGTDDFYESIEGRGDLTSDFTVKIQCTNIGFVSVILTNCRCLFYWTHVHGPVAETSYWTSSSVFRV